MTRQAILKPCKTSHPLIWGVWLLILIHLIHGALILSIHFPFLSQKKKGELTQRWSKKLLTIFNIELRVIGNPILPSTPYLLVSNHISWLDIHAINALQPMRFVAKSEVASWPFFWLDGKAIEYDIYTKR